jgi:hypothetical protein
LTRTWPPWSREPPARVPPVDRGGSRYRPRVNDRQTEALAGWWATLSQEQRAEAKAAPESGNYPTWLLDAINQVEPDDDGEDEAEARRRRSVGACA